MAEDKKHILYRPSIKPKRHYESSGVFERGKNIPPLFTPDDLPDDEPQQSEVDTLLQDLQTLYKLVDYMPLQVQPIMREIIVTITTDTIIRTNPPPDNQPIPPATIIDNTPAYTINTIDSTVDYDDDDFGFIETNAKDVVLEDSIDLPHLIDIATKANLNRVKQAWVDKVKDILQDYLSKMFNAVRLSGAEDIHTLLIDFDGEAVTTTSGSKAKVAHDTIVRNENIISEKSKLMAKMYGADQLIRYLRAIEVAAQTRQEYYNQQVDIQQPSFLKQEQSDQIRAYREIYDNKYRNALTNYHKLMDGSTKLLKDTFDRTAENAMSKGVLIDNNINPFEVTPVPDPIFYVNTLTPDVGEITADGKSSTGNYAKYPAGGIASKTSSGGSAQNITLNGNDNVEKIKNYLKSQGFNNNGIAAILGNMQQESTFNPDASQGGGGYQASIDQGEGTNGFGLIQWTGSRTQALLNFAGADKINTVEAQLQFMTKEMQEYGVLDNIKQASSLDSALSSLGTYVGYGEPGDRASYAQQYLSSMS